MAITPTPGMGATGGAGSDRYPYTIVEVLRNGRGILVAADNYKVISGSVQDGSAEYEYSPNPEAGTVEYTLRKDGRWKLKGHNHVEIAVGHRRAYRDPHF